MTLIILTWRMNLICNLDITTGLTDGINHVILKPDVTRAALIVTKEQICLYIL